MRKIRVVIADDHKILRVGLKAMLQSSKDIDVVNEASGFQELFQVVDPTVDVILMDLDLNDGSGIDATRMLKKKFPEIKILAVSMHEETDLITGMVQAGANGYIMKDTGGEELVQAITAVASGEKYFSNQVSMALMNAIINPGKKKPTEEGVLSQREIEVLKLISQELSNAEIAEKLFISVRTVDSHRRNLLEKLNVKNTAGLVKYAIQKGYL